VPRTAVPPPTNLVSSIPLNRIVWRRDPDDGRIVSVPWFSTLPVVVRVTLFVGSKIN